MSFPTSRSSAIVLRMILGLRRYSVQRAARAPLVDFMLDSLRASGHGIGIPSLHQAKGCSQRGPAPAQARWRTA